MSTLIRSEAVSFYAARVRAELAGVDPEVLEDLTDGLEADLTEALLDAVPAGEEPVAYLTDLAVDVLDERFGTPAEYAAELAQAAEVEIPVRGESDGGRRRRGLRSVLADTRAGIRADATAFVERHPPVRSAWDVVLVLRPVWWLLRGLGLALVVAGALGWGSGRLAPQGALGWLTAIVLVVASIQWGRRLFWQTTWTRRVGRVLSLVGGIAAFVGLATAGSASGAAWNDGYGQGQADAQASSGYTTGSPVSVDGEPVRNLFVYGPDGLPVDGAQIVDQDGRPLVLSSHEAPELTWGEWRQLGPGYAEGQVPLAALTYAGQLNVYPYSWVDGAQVRWADNGRPLAGSPAEVQTPVWPAGTMVAVPADRPATVTPTPVVEPTPSATEGPAPSTDAGAIPGEGDAAPEVSATPEATATP